MNGAGHHHPRRPVLESSPPAERWGAPSRPRCSVPDGKLVVPVAPQFIQCPGAQVVAGGDFLDLAGGVLPAGLEDASTEKEFLVPPDVVSSLADTGESIRPSSVDGGGCTAGGRPPPRHLSLHSVGDWLLREPALGGRHPAAPHTTLARASVRPGTGSQGAMPWFTTLVVAGACRTKP